MLPYGSVAKRVLFEVISAVALIAVFTSVAVSDGAIDCLVWVVVVAGGASTDSSATV